MSFLLWKNFFKRFGSFVGIICIREEISKFSKDLDVFFQVALELFAGIVNLTAIKKPTFAPCTIMEAFYMNLGSHTSPSLFLNKLNFLQDNFSQLTFSFGGWDHRVESIFQFLVFYLGAAEMLSISLNLYYPKKVLFFKKIVLFFRISVP